MPIFSFTCQNCGQVFEEWVRSAMALDEITCTICESEQVERQLSRVAPIGRAGGPALGPSTASCSPGGI